MSNFLKKLKHYVDPRTHIKAAVHLTQRAAYYSNPVTHIKALEQAAHQVSRTAQQAGQFTERQARKDYIKFNRVTAYIAPVVTPILAFIGELVPVFGLIIGPALAFAGAVIARISDSVALRSQGVTGHENSQRARGKQNRTLKYGLIGSAAGGLASAAGLSLTASDAAAAPVMASNGSETIATSANSPAGITLAKTSTDAASSGIFGTGITWSTVGAVLSPLISVGQQVMKQLGIGQPKAAGQGSTGTQLVGLGGDSGGSGTEGTGNTAAEGPLGALGETLGGLPLPIKLGAAALGLGVVALAFKKGKLA